SRAREKGMKRREKDMRRQRRRAEPNLPVFNDLWLQSGGFSRFHFSGRTCKMYQNAISDLLLNCAGTLVHFGAVNSGQWVGSCIRDHVIRRKIFSLSYQRPPRSSAAKISFRDPNNWY